MGKREEKKNDSANEVDLTKFTSEWMEKKAPDFRCPACLESEFGVPSVLLSLPVRGRPDVEMTMLPVSCLKCGFVSMFSAAVMGLC